VPGQCVCCVSGEVETVRHVMMHCTAYNDVRSEWKEAMMRVARNGSGVCREFRVNGMLRNSIHKVQEDSNAVVVRRCSRRLERNIKESKTNKQQTKEMREAEKREDRKEDDEGLLAVGLGGRCPWMTDSEYSEVLLCSQRFVHALWGVRVSIIHPRVKPCGVNGHQAKT
jgi:hypothetical protein